MLLASIRETATVVAPPAFGASRKHAAIERCATLNERAPPGAFEEQRLKLCERAGARRTVSAGVLVAERHDALFDQQAPNATAGRE